ncbi:hypothetical protein DY000_02031310 [Brassica cretica]|uniref:Uncharacterized protein n=1 Tax=Brassica cretica TaxID=69181 RepID=A0ABQ7DWF9_BRACR|nr:hypothetical protein DY000_02031310 [Brassica cretica]
MIPIGPPGMVARTICEDSVLNHPKESSRMKCQSTNCQRRVAVDITMNSLKSEQASSDGAVEDVMLDGAEEALTHRTREATGMILASEQACESEWNHNSGSNKLEQTNAVSPIKNRAELVSQLPLMELGDVNSKKRDFIGELYVGSKRWSWFRLDFEESLDEEMLFVIHLVGFVVSRRLAYAISDKTSLESVTVFSSGSGLSLSDWIFESCGSILLSGLEHPKFRAFSMRCYKLLLCHDEA